MVEMFVVVTDSTGKRFGSTHVVEGSTESPTTTGKGPISSGAVAHSKQIRTSLNNPFGKIQ